MLRVVLKDFCVLSQSRTTYRNVNHYLCYKTIFVIWRKNVSLLRYLDFCVFVKSADLKIHDVIKSIATYGSYNCACFFWLLRSIKMKFGQILVCCMANISDIFLAQCWRLETSSRPFIALLKWQYNKIWSFLIVDVYLF